jgi:transformation/transcription domain-associated protein
MMLVALVKEPKDKEMSVYKQGIEMLPWPLEVWPTTNVNFNYLEKLLSSLQPLGQSKDMSTTQVIDVTTRC